MYFLSKLIYNLIVNKVEVYKMNYSDILVVDKKSEIETAVEEHALYNFGLYHGNLKVYDKEFDSYEEAEEYLCSLRNDGAVKFKESNGHKNFTMKWMIIVSH